MYKLIFTEDKYPVLKAMMPSIAFNTVEQFGLLNDREIGYALKDQPGIFRFNAFEFIDRLNLVLLKMNVTFSLVNYNLKSTKRYLLTIQHIKKTNFGGFKKLKTPKEKLEVDMYEALNTLMELYTQISEKEGKKCFYKI